MKPIFSLLFAILVCAVQAQTEFAIKPLFDLNTAQDEIACMLFEDGLVFMQTGGPDLVSDYQWNARPKFSLHKASRGFDFSKWNKPEHFFKNPMNDIGPASFSIEDSVMYFSSTENFDGARGAHLKIYSCTWNGRRWGSPQWLSWGLDDADYCHPHYVDERRMLVFTSNRFGGSGGMDLWYVLKTEQGWSEPVNPGLGVNSAQNEIFPTYHQGTIYYASNRTDTWGGYDIRRTSGDDQWKTSVAEAAPINSAGDDVCMLFLSDDKAILTSNRAGGRGGDDLFLLQREASPEELHDMQAFVECAGVPSAGVEVSIVNEAGEVIQTAPTDSLGRIDIRALRLNRHYRFQLPVADGGSFAECLLVVTDPLGNRLTEVRFNVKGFAELELLPFRFSAMNELHVQDESVLTLQLEGQLFQDAPGDIGRGETITILDSRGEPVAIAYTNDVGKFRFTRLDPQLNFVMRLSAQTEAKQVLITDKGERISLPVLDAEINYRRVAAEDAVVLVNEYNDSITVSTKDLFVINRIYYDYNSARLTPESRRQLDQLAIILERNAMIGLDLNAHTDARGDAAYNLKLSQQRADAAVHYICSKGLPAGRFQAKGYGETLLLNECSDGVSCSEPEHGLNRRTEIRLKTLTDAALFQR
ncbi:MAG: OmpA family protein [Flavobacteriales bacterium]|jgi:outer membrane protein OmpA-like peptidoglycan-associated protein